MSKLTEEQKRSLEKFGICIVYGKKGEGMSYKNLRIRESNTN